MLNLEEKLVVPKPTESTVLQKELEESYNTKPHTNKSNQSGDQDCESKNVHGAEEQVLAVNAKLLHCLNTEPQDHCRFWQNNWQNQTHWNKFNDWGRQQLSYTL